ncbi:Phosphate transport regulator [Candidatus Rhodobacter oscarellae]|uniref:Phosphate transport regulator n=1 Tax=Candidatus Rhodobacter oscarellae TaxID=1675527 RepID=A0A0J9EB78_9RHOB|nr:LapA family protein [Candidatus Rhodobacter lobularis]KMW59891.1 Phosphate transport regulator [Candidatus Rhodobacter lobularis]
MRYIRYALLALIAIVLITLAVANRGPVTLRLLPEDIANLVRWPEAATGVTVPLFVVIFAGVVLGVLLGFVTEWIREHKFRAEAALGRRTAARLEREVSELKTDKHDGDDVLALLDDASPSR